MSRLPIDSLREFLMREQSLWPQTRKLLDAIIKYIDHHIAQQELETESEHANKALQALKSIAEFEDAAALALGLVSAHQVIATMKEQTGYLQHVLGIVLERPSKSSLLLLEEAISRFESGEEKKLRTLQSALANAA